MTAAVISLLENWNMNTKTVMTGMINPDGSIGPIGGILEKIDAAYSVGANRFLIPKGQMTYLETVFETVTDNGWTQTISKTINRNVSEYAMTKYGIQVIEVEDINEVLFYYTGWVFPIIKSNESITTKDYINSMKPLAFNLLTQASESYINASFYLNNSNISNQYPYYYKNQIADFLNNAKDAIVDAEFWYGENLYYTSTSKSFQSLIDSRFVLYACEYFNSDDEDIYIQDLLSEAINIFNLKSQEAKDAEINGTITLQCVGAAQKRASEADTYISDATNSLESNDFLTALYKIAFAIERSESVGWWLNITRYFNESSSIKISDINTIALEYIEEAQQAITYSSIIIDEMNSNSNYLYDAQNMLEKARAERENGYPAAALFEALEAFL